MKGQSILLAGTLIILSVLSCNRHTNNLQVCNLSSLADSTTSIQSTTVFTYDNQNRLSQVVVSGVNGCKRSYQYFGNTIIFSVTDTTPGIVNELDTIVLTDKGLILTQTNHYPSSGITTAETFFYDDAGNASSSVEVTNGTEADTIIYNTVAGDLLTETEKGSATPKNTFSYYQSKSIAFGDPTDFRQLLYYGAYYYRNKHMLSELYSPGKSYRSYQYTFDGNRIATQTQRVWKAGSQDTVTHLITYSYNCK